MHMELKDLPPGMRAQALRQLAAQEQELKKRKTQLLMKAKAERKRFESRGEYEYYIGTVLPGIRSGKIKKCQEHPAFRLFDPAEYCDVKLGAIRYTSDFRIDYADGSTEIVEIKSRFVRRQQRDYPLRRRLFIEQYARPNGWKFTEIITDEKKKDIEAWKEGLK